MADEGGGDGGIQVSGGGTVVVGSDEMLARVDSMGEFARLVTHCHSQANRVLSELPHHSRTQNRLPTAVAEAREALDTAAVHLSAAEAEAHHLVGAVRLVIAIYSEAERLRAAFFERLEAEAASLAGTFAPLLVPVGIRVLVEMAPVVLPTILAGYLYAQTRPGGIAGVIERHEGLVTSALTSPVAVGMVRTTVSTADDFTAGLLHLPAQGARSSATDGAAPVAESAAIVVGVAELAGLAKDGPVKVHELGSPSTTSAPRNLAEAAERIPQPGGVNGDTQVRIESYARPGQPTRFVVYVAGTADFSPITGRETFNLASDLRSVAGESSSAYRTVVDAMAKAGITPTTPVQFYGHSLGGSVVSQIAGSGRYTVTGVATFGAPAGGIEIPAHIPVLRVEHTDDLVPALAGHDVSLHPLVVREPAFPTGDVPTDSPLPAHALKSYITTAQHLEHQARSAAVRSALARLDGFLGGGDDQASTPGTVTEWRSEPVAK